MSNSFAIRARNGSISKSSEFIALATFNTSTQLNDLLKEIYQLRTDLRGKELEFLSVDGGFLIQFNNSRIKPADVYVTNPKLLAQHKESLISGEWLNLNSLEKILIKSEQENECYSE